MLVFCFLISENKVTRVSGSKWEGYSVHTYPHDCKLQWIHLFPFSPHIITNSSCNFIILVPIICFLNCAVIISTLRNIWSLNPAYLYQPHSLPGPQYTWVGNYKGEGKYTFEKAPSRSPSKCEKSFLLLALQQRTIEETLFWPHKPLSHEANVCAKCGPSTHFANLCKLGMGFSGISGIFKRNQ